MSVQFDQLGQPGNDGAGLSTTFGVASLGGPSIRVVVDELVCTSKTAAMLALTSAINEIERQTWPLGGAVGVPVVTGLSDAQRRKLQRIADKSGDVTEQFHWLAQGDSWTDIPGYYIGELCAALVAKYGDAGGGYSGFTKRGGNSPYGNARPALYPVSVTGGNTNNTGDSAPQASIDLGSIIFTSAGSVTFGLPSTPQPTRLIVIYRSQTSGTHQLRWRVNGSDYTTVTLTNDTTSTIRAIDLSAFIPIGASTWDVEWVAGTVELFGCFSRSDQRGFLLSKAASSGSGLFGWGNASGGFPGRFGAGLSVINAVAPIDVISMMCMITDQIGGGGTGRTKEQFSANLDAWVDNVRAPLPHATVLLCCEPEVKQSTSTLLSVYQDVVKAKAASTPGAALVDLQSVFGAVPSTVVAGGAALPYLSTGSNPKLLNESDKEKHPDPRVRAEIVNAFRAIFG